MTTDSRSGTDLGMLLAACCERLVRGLFGRLAAAGWGHLTPSEALTVLLVGDGIDTVTQIADRVGMTTQAISKICTTLYAEGLLERQPHSGDARSRRLALTAEGQRMLALMRQAGNEAERAWTDLIGTETMGTVRGALAAYAHAPETTGPTAVPAAPIRIRFT
jgi:DNA-binding MarR family transcriptional regulator